MVFTTGVDGGQKRTCRLFGGERLTVSPTWKQGIAPENDRLWDNPLLRSMPIAMKGTCRLVIWRGLRKRTAIVFRLNFSMRLSRFIKTRKK